MAVVVSGIAHVLISQDDEFLKKLFEEEFTFLDPTSFLHGGGRKLLVKNGATDTISLEGITTAGLLFVKSNRQVSVLLTHANGVDQEIILGSAQDDEGMLQLIGAYTGLKINNQSTADADVVVAYAGTET